MKSLGITHLGWDFDGVIANSREMAWAAGRGIMSLFGRNDSVATPEQYHELFSVQSQISTVGTAHAATLRLMHRLIMRHNALRFELFEHVVRLLAEINVAQSIVTSSFADGCRLALGEHVRHFQTIVGFEAGRKPEILPAVVPQNALYVTDSAGDVNICRRSAIRCIAVTWGFDSVSQLERSQPDHLVQSADELRGVFDSYGLLQKSNTVAVV